MSKRLKKLLSVALVVVLSLGVGLVFKLGLHSKAAYIDPGTYGDFEYKQMEYRDWWDAENRIEITKYNGSDSVVTIPDKIEGMTVRSIGDNAFQGNIYLTKIVFPDDLQEIHVGAFMDCINLSNVALPKSLHRIWGNAFANCESLEHITIPNVSGRDNGVAYDSIGYVSVPVKDENGQYVYDKYGNSTNYSPFEGSGLKYVTIEDGVKSIPWQLFEDCSNISSLVVPDSVEIIGEGAFRRCTNLERVEFGNGSNLKELRGFEECSKLTYINVPHTVETIGGFCGSGLESVVLPDTITKIEIRAFYDCINLEELTLPKYLKSLGSQFIYGTGVTTITLPKTLESGGSAFEGSNVEIEFEKGFETIPARLFKGILNESIELPDTLKSIGRDAFSGCKFEEITIPKSVDDIDHYTNPGFSNVHGALQPIKKVYGYSNSGADRYCQIVDSHTFYPLDKDDLPKIEGSFKVQDSGTFKVSEGKGFCYSDRYFYDPATTYNPSLATMSLSLAFSTYGKKVDENNKKSAPDYENYDQNVKDVLHACGFTGNIDNKEVEDDYDRYMSYNYNQKPTTNGIACAIGSKKIPGGYTIIAVAVRSGGYGDEWASNLKMGKNYDHAGFKEAATSVCYAIDGYMSKYQLGPYYAKKSTEKKVKIWITGYSRGAAVASMTAEMLNNHVGDFRNKYPKENVYAYCFATPASATTSQTWNQQPFDVMNQRYYNNIFNIIDYNDPVPLVAPSSFPVGESFSRYGITKVLPYKETASKSVNNNYIKEVKRRMGKEAIDPRITNLTGQSDVVTAFFDSLYKQTGNNIFVKYLFRAEYLFSNWLINHFKYTSIGTFMRNAFARINIALFSRSNYVAVYQNDLMTAMDKADGDLLNEYGKLGKAWKELLLVFLKLNPGFVDKHYDYTATMVANNKHLFDVHATPDHYLTWMRLMDPNYPDSLPVKWGESNYRAVSISGIGDILIYDVNNELVASVVDGQLSDSDDLDICIAKDENGSTVVYLPPSEDYNVQIAAKDNGKVTYSVDEYVAASGTKTRNVAYSSVPVSKGETLIGTVTAYSSEELENGTTEASSAEYCLQKDEEPLEASHDFTANEIKSHQYNVVTEEAENGILFGGGSFTVGTVAQVAAVPDIGFQIDKFYLNGEEIVDDNLDEDDSTINFEVNGNSTVSATFKKAPGLFSSNGTELTSKSSTTLFYNDLDEDALNHTYKFIVHNKTTNQWYKLRDFDAESSIEWFTGVAGEKSLYVDIKDITTDTIVKRVELNVTVSDPAFNIDSFTISPDTTVVPNMSATLEANVSGGTGDYLYKFIVYNQNTKQWYKLRDFAPENTFDWFTGPEGEKTLYVDVKDASNDTIVKRAELNVSVSDPKLKVESFTIEPEGELATNTRALLQAKAIGGVGDYQYKFIVYNEATKQWYKLKDFGPESTYDWYTGPAGHKTLYVDVKDADGTVVRKGLSVIVK